MTPSFEEEGKAGEGKRMNRGSGFALFALALVLPAAAAGCQQKMAEQPYYRPYEPTDFFKDGRSARPLEPGVVHRAQHLDSDPMVTGLTQAEWSRFWKGQSVGQVDVAAATPPENRAVAYGAPRFDPRPGQPHSSPDQVYVTEFPFEITGADLSRGADRYTTYCAVCHGPLGNGKGKIWERGYLKPTSYHAEPVEVNEPVTKRDSTGKEIPKDQWDKVRGQWFDNGNGQIPLGYSRGYWKWDIHIPVSDVPAGYIFEVITKGYGAMGDYAAQIKPDDRWRIVAYVRTLQMSQRADVSKLPRDVLEKLKVGGNHP